MDNMQKIPVFFTFDANYLLAAKVAIHSMMKHASQQYWYELYVFHTTLSPKSPAIFTEQPKRIYTYRITLHRCHTIQ